MTKQSLLFLITFFLLFNIYWDRESQIGSFFRPTPFPFTLRTLDYPATAEGRRLVPLTHALFVGATRGIDRKMKRDFAILNLQHLFTPSGVHLSACLWLLGPPLFFLRRPLRQRIRWGVQALIALFFLWLPGSFYALKRIALFTIFSLASARWIKAEVAPFLLFTLAFGADFLFGTFCDSPLSFTYSFYCLGIIYSAHRFKQFLLPLYFFAGQILFSYFNDQPIYFLSLPLNTLLTLAFAITYPVMLICYVVQLDGVNFFLLHHLVDWTQTASWWALRAGNFNSSLILLVLLFLLMGRWRWTRWQIALLLFLHAQPLHPLAKTTLPYTAQTRELSAVPALPVDEVLYLQKGTKIILQNKMKCQIQDAKESLITKCTQPRKGKKKAHLFPDGP